jgi:hypothetical protein
MYKYSPKTIEFLDINISGYNVYSECGTTYRLERKQRSEREAWGVR